MTNIQTKTEKLHSCTPIGMQPCNSEGTQCNTPCNFHATDSLKALAIKVLERNRLCNFRATTPQKPCNFHATTKGQKLHRSCAHEDRYLIRIIVEFLNNEGSFYGTYGELYKTLDRRRITIHKLFPSSTEQLIGRLKKLQPALKELGVIALFCDFKQAFYKTVRLLYVKSYLAVNEWLDVKNSPNTLKTLTNTIQQQWFIYEVKND